MKRILTIAIVISASFVTAQLRPKEEPAKLAPTPIPKRGATESTWSLLSLEACGVESFLKQYPQADGRGTIIAILDDGVDPGLAGLLKTSEGKAKIIDVQDFSGTGDLYWQAAGRSGNTLRLGEAVVLSGLERFHAYNGRYYYAALSEKRFQNGLGDLNFNSRKNDTFGVVIFEDKEHHWSAVVDADGDKSIGDEPVLTTYREGHDLFRFRPATDDTTGGLRYLSGAVNIFPDEKRINLYFADGGHGTHVAGMAAGYNIDGQAGFNGVAPGAEVVALKFSDNTQSGITVSGSMKAAYEYVVRLARQSDKPVIANMSFGIGSEIEGQSAMDIWLDSLLDTNPDVVVCISGSNDGPGLSNIGLPGSARTPITSGAALPDDTGRDLYGVMMTQPVVWDFSSRGGELAKPDIVSPGTAVSTVPDYVMNDRYNGTSMASPFTTGCCALLISGMRQQFPGYKPAAHVIKRALQLGAKPLAGYTPLDQGAGMINVPRAFEYLSAWYRKGAQPREYIIEAHMPGSASKARAAYYRSGILPRNAERTVFHIKPVTKTTTASRDEIVSFNAYTLRSDASWLEPVQSSIYQRGLGQLEVAVRYDQKQLTKPGLYVGKILAYPKGKAATDPDFELWNTVVIPHLFEESNDYTVHIPNIALRGSQLRREFFRIPAGSAGLRFTLERRGTKTLSATVFDNDGRACSWINLMKDRDEVSKIISGENLPRGVIELVLKSGLGDDDEREGVFDLTVEAYPLDVHALAATATETGAHAILSLSNASTRKYDLSLDASIAGYERLIDTLITGSDNFFYPFRAHGGEEAVMFDIELYRKDYNLFTDIALQVLTSEGRALVNSAFDERQAHAEMRLRSGDSATYTLSVHGGLALPNRGDSFRLIIRERRVLANEFGLRAEPRNIELAPAQEEQVRVVSTTSLPSLPEGYNWYGGLSGSVKPTGKLLFPLGFSK